MARRRYISTKLSTDTRVNQLALEAGDFAVMLYTWMVPHAEDDGTLTGDAEELLFTVIPGRRDKSVDDVRAALDTMVRLDLIAWLPDGRLGFPVDPFYRYQSYVRLDARRSEEQRESAPPSIEEAPLAENAEEQRESAENTASFSFSVPVSPSVPVSVSPRGPTRPRAQPPPQSEPFAVLQELCDLADADVTDLGNDKAKHCAVVKRLLVKYPRDDLTACWLWMLSDTWRRQRGLVDVFKLEQAIAGWIIAGRPAAVTQQTRGAPNGRAEADELRAKTRRQKLEHDRTHT